MIDESKDYVTKSKLTMAVNIMTGAGQHPNKQTDSETQKLANIKAKKQKGMLTNKSTSRLTGGHKQTER